MKNKIKLFLMILLLVFLFLPKSFAQSIQGKIYEDLSVQGCVQDSHLHCLACTTALSFYYEWTESELPPNYEWMSSFCYNTGYNNPYCSSQACWGGSLGGPRHGAYLISSNGSPTYGCVSSLNLQQQENQYNNLQFQGWAMYLDMTKINNYPIPYQTGCSDIAHVTNPSNAPIGSPINSPPDYGVYGPSILTSYEKLTLTMDPVNIATGEDYFSSTDFSLNARGPKLALSRKYRSFSTLNGMFGYGWRTDFDINLSQDSSGDVTIFDGDGTGSYFINYSGVYAPSPGNNSILTKNTNNTFTLTDKHGNVYQYSSSGRLMSRSDRNGNTLTFVYNPAQVGGTYIKDANGRLIKLYFDANKHIISSQDPAGHVFKYGYDVNGNLISVVDPSGAVTDYYYDSNHKIIQFTNANGHNTYYQYDSQGRCVMNWRDNNVNKVTLSYQPNNTTIVMDSLGKKSTYVFNNYALLLSKTDPLGGVTQETWDHLLNRTSITDAKNNLTSFMSDAAGNLVQITDPLNNQTNFTYTPNFNLISTKTDALGNVTNFVYDIKGNLTAVIDSLGKTHSFVYDQYGNITTATDSLGNNTKFIYDAYGRITQKTNALNNKTNFSYDTVGNLLVKKDARGFSTSFAYDKLNRLIKITFPDASTIVYAYDLFGNQISVTDQRVNKLIKIYDAYERLSQTKDPNGGVTQFSYDTEGHLLSLTDANTHKTSYTYDADARVLTQTNALNYVTTFTYDKLGNLATRKDANGNTTTYTYDALNRLTNISYP